MNADFEYRLPSARESAAIMAEARRLRAETFARGFRAALAFLSGLLRPAGQPQMR